MADQEQEWNARHYFDAKSRQPIDGWQHAHPGCRCLGARLLSQVPKPQARLSQSLVERRELGRRGEELLIRLGEFLL